MGQNRALGLYLAYCLLTTLLRATYFTAVIVYYITVVGLGPFQLVLVGTTLMVTILLAEVPTGVLADVYSRRLSVIVGTALVGAGFIFEASFASFAAVLVAQLIWGVGITFTSGALEAWVADELGGEGLDTVYVRGGQLAVLGELLGIGLGIGLAAVALRLPLYVAGGGLIALALALAAVMPERGWRPRPPEERGSWRALAGTARAGVALVRGSGPLLALMGVTFFFGMASESFDRLWEIHFLTHLPFPGGLDLTPVTWFGLISGAALLMSVGLLAVTNRYVERFGERGLTAALAGATALVMLGMIGFGLAAGFGVGLVCFWVTMLLRRAISPLYVAWLNRHAKSEVRATVNSLAGQVDALGQIAGGPLFGLLAAAASTRASLALAGLMLLPALLLYARLLWPGALARRAPAELPLTPGE
jgi:DHA3 family tetracycline resistance protein-like MFS transporter